MRIIYSIIILSLILFITYTKSYVIGFDDGFYCAKIEDKYGIHKVGIR